MVICPLYSDVNGNSTERTGMDILNCLETGAVIALAIGVACFLITLHMQNHAVEGYEDETGFHYGRKEDK